MTFACRRVDEERTAILYAAESIQAGLCSPRLCAGIVDGQMKRRAFHRAMMARGGKRLQDDVA